MLNTSTETVACPASVSELDLSAQEYIDITDMVYLKSAITNSNFESRFRPLLSRLEAQGYIGSNPLKHWAKNQVLCQLDIINPDLTIQDRPFEHVTSFIQDQFKRHVEALLAIDVIRPSTSRHQTMVIMVNSGTTIDPLTGKEVKGKERMVFNYRTPNDNTHKDQYSLPGINTILKRIDRSEIFSKFDLKSDFHQVAMYPDSIISTAFLVPGGLYEWLVMPFGLKNAHAVFQRKMDHVYSCLHRRHPRLLSKRGNACPAPTGHATTLAYIPNLGTLLGLLYNKTSPHGDKKLKPSNIDLINKIKQKVQDLPDLELPPAQSYIVLETDGYMEECPTEQEKFHLQHLDESLSEIHDEQITDDLFYKLSMTIMGHFHLWSSNCKPRSLHLDQDQLQDYGSPSMA
ncbi:Polyprotein P3-like protein [Drosera capensis]